MIEAAIVRILSRKRHPLNRDWKRLLKEARP